MHKLLLRIVACIHLAQGAKLRVRSEGEIDAARRPLRLPSRAHAPAEARAHVLERYFDPLCAYARASSNLRLLGEPPEIVNAFFAARFADDTYLARWTSSGIPLRRWLANGLMIHARNTLLAARRRAEHGGAVDPKVIDEAYTQRVDHETNALLALERAWAVRTVTEAHERVRTELQAEGRGAWWELFRLHTLHGMGYAQAAPIVGVSLPSASSIHRQVVDRLRATLHDILARDGIGPDELDRELAMMQDMLG